MPAVELAVEILVAAIAVDAVDAVEAQVVAEDILLVRIKFIIPKAMITTHLLPTDMKIQTTIITVAITLGWSLAAE